MKSHPYAVRLDKTQRERIKVIADADYDGNISMALRKVLRVGLTAYNPDPTVVVKRETR